MSTIEAILCLIGGGTVAYWFMVRGFPGLRGAWSSIPNKLPMAWTGLLAVLVFFAGMRVMYPGSEAITLRLGHLLGFLATWAVLFFGGRVIVSAIRSKK